jgi:uncharacterized protein
MIVSFRASNHAPSKGFRLSEAVKFNATTTDAGRMRIEGLAVVYGPLSSERYEKDPETGEMKSYFVRIADGAAVYANPTVALFNHNPDLLLGNTANGTLEIENRTEGIWIAITPPNTQLGRDTFELVKSGYCNGASFKCVPTEEAEYYEAGRRIVEYRRMFVSEFTVTPTPAFSGTDLDIGQIVSQPAKQPEPIESDYVRHLPAQRLHLRVMESAIQNKPR